MHRKSRRNAKENESSVEADEPTVRSSTPSDDQSTEEEGGVAAAAEAPTRRRGRSRPPRGSASDEEPNAQAHDDEDLPETRGDRGGGRSPPALNADELLQSMRFLVRDEVQKESILRSIVYEEVRKAIHREEKSEKRHRPSLVDLFVKYLSALINSFAVCVVVSLITWRTLLATAAASDTMQLWCSFNLFFPLPLLYESLAVVLVVSALFFAYLIQGWWKKRTLKAFVSELLTLSVFYLFFVLVGIIFGYIIYENDAETPNVVPQSCSIQYQFQES